MALCTRWMTIAMLVPTSIVAAAENPWKDKVAPAVAEARRAGTVSAFEKAFDAAWRADDWQAGLDLARRQAESVPENDQPRLASRVVRALWRAGQIEEAEQRAERLPKGDGDRVALQMQITLAQAGGRLDDARRAAERLEKLGDLTAEEMYLVFGVKLASGGLGGGPALLEKMATRIDPNQGYPDIYLAESISGLREFLLHVGDQPLNQIARHGSSPMGALIMFGLPSCDVMINGRGPYKMIIDTGGSIMLSLDEMVAEEIGLKSIAPASVRGVSGKQETGQVLLDSLVIGDIELRRVVGRTFDVRSAILNAADGIIGTGMFDDGRLTLDFAQGKMVVAESSATPGTGVEAPMRLVGDAKMMAIVKVQGAPAVGLLDSGADAIALAPSKLEKLFPDRDILRISPGIGLGVGSEETPEIALTPGVSFAYAGRTWPSYGGLGLDVLDTLLSPILGVQTDILLGMPMFRETRSITVDFPRAKLWIDWLPSSR